MPNPSLTADSIPAISPLQLQGPTPLVSDQHDWTLATRGSTKTRHWHHKHYSQTLPTDITLQVLGPTPLVSDQHDWTIATRGSAKTRHWNPKHYSHTPPTDITLQVLGATPLNSDQHDWTLATRGSAQTRDCKAYVLGTQITRRQLLPCWATSGELSKRTGRDGSGGIKSWEKLGCLGQGTCFGDIFSLWSCFEDRDQEETERRWGDFFSDREYCKFYSEGDRRTPIHGFDFGNGEIL